MEETGSESASGDHEKTRRRRNRYLQKRRTVVNPDENFYFYWLMVLTVCILYNFWTLIVRQSFPELQVCNACLSCCGLYSAKILPKLKIAPGNAPLEREEERESDEKKQTLWKMLLTNWPFICLGTDTEILVRMW